MLRHCSSASLLWSSPGKQTPNAQHRTSNENRAHWAFDVRCSVFDVCFCLLQVEESSHGRRYYIHKPQDSNAEASRHTPDLLSPNTTTMTSRPGREPLAIKQCPAASV